MLRGLAGVNNASIAAYLATATLAAGTITTSQPMTLTQTWNAAGVTFTLWKSNATDTASAALSRLSEWQIGGTPKVSLIKDGSQRFWNSYTDDSNNEYGFARWSSNVFQVGATKTGTGTNRDFAIVTAGGTWTFEGATGVGTTSFPNSLTIGGSGNVNVTNAGTFAWGSGRAKLLSPSNGVLKPVTDASANGGYAIITKAGAFAASDVPTDSALFGYDSSGGTRKLYINQGGTLYSVALA